jgi:hypothetical protein
LRPPPSPNAQPSNSWPNCKPEALALYRRALSVQQENLARNPKEAVRAAIRALELKVVELEGE